MVGWGVGGTAAPRPELALESWEKPPPAPLPPPPHSLQTGEHSAAGLRGRGSSARGGGRRGRSGRQGGAEGARRGPPARQAPRSPAQDGRQGALRAPARPPPGRRGRALPAAAAAAAAWAAPCPRWSRRRRRRELDADGARAGPWGSSASRTRSALLSLPASSFQGPAPPPREPGDVRPRLGPSPGLPRLPPRPTPCSPQPSRCPWGPGDRPTCRGSPLQPGPQSGAPPATPLIKPGVPPAPHPRFRSGPLSERRFFLQPPLVQAIFSRDVEEVRSLLSQKENINVLVSWDQGGWGASNLGPGVLDPSQPVGRLRGSLARMRPQLFLPRDGRLLYIWRWRAGQA